MRAFVRNCLRAASLLALSGGASATAEQIYIPLAPNGPGGEDSIETSSGTRCRQSINSNGTYLDAGVAGTAAKPMPDAGRNYFTDTRDQQAMAYVRVTVPIGKRPKRIDCSSIYELEIQRLQREVELLKMAAE
ncbi:hypothetical protein IC614_01240 [Allosphingosinicella flava]|uniref:Secreted protein n=1 Tax=Allosphingosinicella flava TaxID=2771430 RepID=A0A7T2GJY9_9SPHN|nr:hypothetical protein [Sphingosinicella flava]QPQ55272.1 hypothetical protein IC614_01240 [Sphingosinicella flava]